MAALMSQGRQQADNVAMQIEDDLDDVWWWQGRQQGKGSDSTELGCQKL
jgi:hypothetical protein